MYNLHICKSCGKMSFNRKDFIRVYNYEDYCQALVCMSCFQNNFTYKEIKTEYVADDLNVGNYTITKNLYGTMDSNTGDNNEN